VPQYQKMKNDHLRKAGIRHYDLLIHDQPKEWLIKNFSQGADEYPVNVARLMRNYHLADQGTHRSRPETALK